MFRALHCTLDIIGYFLYESWDMIDVPNKTKSKYKVYFYLSRVSFGDAL